MPGTVMNSSFAKFIIGSTLLLAACGEAPLAVPFYRTSDATPEWLSESAALKPDMHHVANFALTDQYRATVTDSNLKGRATIIHFFFTTCAGVCPTTQTNIARLLAHTKESRIQVLSHSVVPERDSVPALQMYASMHDIHDSRWHLLTGEKLALEALAEKSYFVNLHDGKSYGISNLAHTETLVLVDGHGRLRGMYTGSLPLDIQRLQEDIVSILGEH